MSIECRKCGKGAHAIGGFLKRVNEKGMTGIWECEPSCNADLPFETKLLLAIEGSEGDENVE